MTSSANYAAPNDTNWCQNVPSSVVLINEVVPKYEFKLFVLKFLVVKNKISNKKKSIIEK